MLNKTRRKLMQDIRWIQRFQNYKKALKNLKEFLSIEKMSKFEKQGFVKAFECVYELAWKTLQDLMKEKGYEGVVGPKPVISRAFSDGYLKNAESWREVHRARNLAAHLYDESFADSLEAIIKDSFIFLFSELETVLEKEEKNHSD